MSRLVRIPKLTELDPVTTGTDNVFAQTRGDRQVQAARAPDNYLERIGKYFPGEVLAFFIFLNAILAQAAKAGGLAATMAGLPIMAVAYGVLAVSIVLVPLFVWYIREDGDAWLMNAAVSTVLFPFWAYALGAVAFSEHWDGNLAVILLATVTVLSGLISPPALTAKPTDEPTGAPPRTERPRLDVISTTPWS
jgi:hypothetical protein